MSPLSPPVPFTVIRQSPPSKPNRPFPCGFPQDDILGGYATPPDLQGRATVHLCWDVGGASPTTALRYEVARALDSSILAAHLRNWKLGKVEEAEIEPPLINGVNADGTLSEVTFDTKRGVYRAKFKPIQQGIFQNGRLSQNTLFFEVTFSKPHGDSIQLLLRSATQDVPTAGPAKLEAQPNYDGLMNDIAAIQQLLEQVPPTKAREVIQAVQKLAQDNPECFGMATGVPIAATDFLDEIPGKGSSRYFYRVRAVDPGGNTSEWSDVSVPFHTVDTTPPDAVRQLQAFPGDRTATLVWAVPADRRIQKFNVYRSEDDEIGTFNVQNAVPHAIVCIPGHTPTDCSGIVTSRPLVAIGGSLTLPLTIEVPIPAGTRDDQITTFVATQTRVGLRDGTAPAPNLFDPVTGNVRIELQTKPDGSRIALVRSISGLRDIPSDAALTMEIGSTRLDGDPAWYSWTDRSLEGGKKYGYHIAAGRTAKTAPAAPGQQPNEIILIGGVSLVRATGMDRSIPPAPTIIAAEWVDADGNLLTFRAEGSRLRLTIQAANNANHILVQRSTQRSGNWVPVSIDGLRGWRPWPFGLTQLIVVDNTIRLNEAWDYRALIRANNGLASQPSPVIGII